MYKIVQNAHLFKTNLLNAFRYNHQCKTRNYSRSAKMGIGIGAGGIKKIKLGINKENTDKIQINSEEKNFDEKISNSSTAYKDNVNDNLYLQICSCLNKLNAFTENEAETKEKITSLIKRNNSLINDEEIMRIVTTFSDSDSKLEKSENLAKILEDLEKIIEEEISEEEFADDSDLNIRFIRPPHNVKELKKVFNQAEKIYEENKKILLSNDAEVTKEYQETFMKKIPNYLTLRTLQYPSTKSEIMVVGVQRNSDTHSLFTSELLSTINPDLVAIHMSPDLPIFLNGDGDYKKDWKAYVTNKSEYEYLVNPLPKSASDVLLSSRKVEKMLDSTFTMSDDISISRKIVFSTQRAIPVRKQENIYADTFLTPFIYSFTSRNGVNEYCPIAICDYPRLMMYQDIVSSTPMGDLKEIFMKVIDEMSLQNYFFSYDLYAENIFLSDGKSIRRMDYTAELLRQLTYSSKKIVLVVDHNHVDTLIECWKNLTPEIQPINSFYNNLNSQKESDKEINFSDFIEKLVIIDVLQGSFLHENFVKYNTFPFPFRPEKSWISGWKNLFMVWNHFYNHYSNLIGSIPFNNLHYNELLKKFNIANESEFDIAEEENKMKKEMLDELNNFTSINKK